MVTHVFFDAAGTLFRVRGSVGTIYAQQARRFGIDVAPEVLERAFTAAFREPPAMAFGEHPSQELEGLERAWWKGVVQRTLERVGEPGAQLDVLFEALYETFRGSQGWELEPGCLETLRRLREEKKHLGVISNFDSRLTDVLDDLGLGGYFEAVVFSSRAPAAKPDPAIFRLALRQAGAQPESSLHVGDNPVDDCEGARSAGLGVLLYDPQDRYRESTRSPRIRNLAEVRFFLL